MLREPPSKSWNCGGGCLRRSRDHRETGFPTRGRTTKESLPETPLNAKSEEEEECPGFSLPLNLPAEFPIGQIYPEATGHMTLTNAVCKNQPHTQSKERDVRDWILKFLEMLKNTESTACVSK